MRLEYAHTNNGKLQSFGKLYDEMAPRMLYYAFKMTQDKQASEDIIHETFVYYWENRDKLDSVLDIKSYLFSILRNLLRNHVRLESNRKRILDNMEPPEDDAEDYMMLSAEISGQIRHVINQLPAQTRTVIELSMAGMSVGQISGELNISQNTVKTLKKRGYRFLREHLGHLRLLIYFLLFP
jgi:RNA polymerase sigma-70 factor (family 1)